MRQKQVYANQAVVSGDVEANRFVGAEAIVSGDVTVAGSVDATAVTVGGVSLILPPGVVLPYGGTTAPSGYLLCDGSAVSRTTYAALFTAIGTAYGAGDGTTTFNVPQMSGGNFPRGGAVGSTGGSNTHTHTFTAGAHSHGVGNHIHPLSNNGQALITVGGGSVGGLMVNASYTDNEKTTSSMTTAASSTSRSNAASLAGNTDQGGPGSTFNATTSGTTDQGSSLPPYVAFQFIIKF